MATHFGMKFGVKHNGTIHWNCIGKVNEPFEPLQRPEDILDPISEPQPLYIHPDSKYLLMVQLGDIVSLDKAMERYALVSVEDLRDSLNEAGDYKIIERAGKCFHWPESEEVEQAV